MMTVISPPPISQVQIFSLQSPGKNPFNNSKSLFTPVRFEPSCCVTTQGATELHHPTSSSAHESPWTMPRRRDSSHKNHSSVPQREDIEQRLKLYSSLLGDCALREALNEGKAIHGNQIKNGVAPDSHFWISLINLYAKCGYYSYARQVLDEMPEQDVVSWTAFIQGFVALGNAEEGIGLFCEMRKKGVRPNEFTVATCLKACSMCLDVCFGKQVQAEAVKEGLLSDVFIGSALVNLYAKCYEMDLADKVFFCMPEQNEVLWNVLINGHAQVGDGKRAFRLFCQMLNSEVEFSKFTLSSVLKGCANSGDLRSGHLVHCLAIKSGCELDKFFVSNLIDLYCKCDLVDDALKLFRKITDHDVVSWSAMIACLDQQGHSREAIKLFYLMRHTGIKPNQFTFSSVVIAAAESGDLHYGESIHACILKYGFESNISISNALIGMYMKNGCVDDGSRVFEAMTEPDLVSWNTLLSGFHDYDSCESSGPSIFYQMLVEGFRPNMYTFISVLRSCSSLLDINFGKQVHAQILKNNLDENEYVGTALLDMYAKCRCMEESYIVFARSIGRDAFAWTVMVTGYAQTDQEEKAMKFFNSMRQEGVKPNEFAIAACLSGCSRLTAAESGRQLHSTVIKSGLLNDMYVSGALVDMYAKCGCIEDAETIFKGLVRRDTVLWNTMICGFSLHGQGDKALETFQTMKDEGNLPNEVTFIGVLSACSHMGLIEEGKQHFNSMSGVYGISPRDEHYACMVNILGRAGRFADVETFIEEMKLSNVLIWEAVLGACAKHGNVKFGERAAEKLFELKHETDSTYVLLSNIFASKGKWEEVKKVRTLMSSHGVKKEPGCSWVEINNEVHVFVSDGSHPNIREIRLKLEELFQKLRFVGYVPQIEHVLHDIPDKEKKEHLNHHSEKLALAFALMSNSNTKRIRIFKNLRICCDCHDFMKLVSNITNREIVVRDTNRFHHFKDGSCSCQDYW